MINFYYCFIPGCAATLKPLNVPLASTKGNATLAWNDNSTTAFTRIQDASATHLVHSTHNAPTCYMTDASESAVGAVLQQFLDNQCCPIAYFSKALKPSETRYSTFDHELLAQNISGILLRVVPFTFLLTTNTSPSHSQQSPIGTLRQTRHLDLISQYISDIRHVNDISTGVACPYVPPVSIPFTVSLTLVSVLHNVF